MHLVLAMTTLALCTLVDTTSSRQVYQTGVVEMPKVLVGDRRRTIKVSHWQQ